MFDFIPDAARLSNLFSEAIAPTFFLGAIAAFVSLMASRLSAVVQRLQHLHDIPQEDHGRAFLKEDTARLKRRACYLHSGIVASLYSGLCATILLAILFLSAFFRWAHAFGAPLLFVAATGFLGFGLVRFTQEARIGLAEADEHR